MSKKRSRAQDDEESPFRLSKHSTADILAKVDRLTEVLRKEGRTTVKSVRELGKDHEHGPLREVIDMKPESVLSTIQDILLKVVQMLVSYANSSGATLTC
eukprot:scaffold931_cov383-Prasinococcus_capsulatus_cf.AAC.29